MTAALVQPDPFSDREAISRFAIPPEGELPDHVRTLRSKFLTQYGFVPNWFSALTANPDTAYRLVVFYEHLFDSKRSHLKAADRELVAVVSSAINECSYCVFNHTQSLASAIDDRIRAQRIARDHHHVPLSEREAALADIPKNSPARPGRSAKRISRGCATWHSAKLPFSKQSRSPPSSPTLTA